MAVETMSYDSISCYASNRFIKLKLRELPDSSRPLDNPTGAKFTVHHKEATTTNVRLKITVAVTTARSPLSSESDLCYVGSRYLETGQTDRQT